MLSATIRLPLPARPTLSGSAQGACQGLSYNPRRSGRAPPHRACRGCAALPCAHGPAQPSLLRIDDVKLGAPEAWAQLAPHYQLGHEVGRGSFATVFEALDTRTGHRLAAKKVPKCRPSRLAEEQTAAVAAEAATQAALAAASTHHVLQLVDVRQSASHFYLISELCCCDLASYLSGRLSPCTEREAGHIAAQLLSALAACHRAGVAYRDVKPANLCVRSVDANGLPAIVLADFGCSRSVSAHGSGDRASAGTPLYSAPECMQGSGGMEGDVWGAGVLLYSLLSGTFPFCDPRTFNITQGEYWRRVAEQPIHYSGRAWQHVSPGAVSLLRRMLDRDCSQRISAAAALQDPWLLAQTSPAGNVLPGSPLKQQNLLAAVAMSPLLHASV